MTISIWRYSHLTLAVSSFLFVLTASVTGIILAFEPISNQLHPSAITNADNVTIAQTLQGLQKEYKEIVALKITEHNFLEVDATDKNEKNVRCYVHPITGKKSGELIEKAPVFKFATKLHRSLFLKSTGRFLVALASFLLLLIALSGLLLIAKRQGGIFKFFNKVVKEDFNQFWHVVLGKYTLLPIIVITLTGVYLSLEKFSLLPKQKIKHNYEISNTSFLKIPITDFDIFKTTKLSELSSIEFPFSEDEEDFFFVKLKDKEFIIHQYSGEIISYQKLSWITIVSNWSLFLHTGRGTIIWSVILMLSCFSILFFIFSGFSMTFERLKKSSLLKNKITKDDAEIIILVGSETGSTYRMAISLLKALLSVEKPVFIDVLNNYTTYENAEHLLILTSTFGEGEAPTNASKFKERLKTFQQQKQIQFSVVGFGSLAYPDYCQFAIEVDELLQQQDAFLQITPLHKINNQSFSEFKNWALTWSKITQITLELQQEIKKNPKQFEFKVARKSELNQDDTFILRLQPKKNIKFTSGDLLAITPQQDNVTRLYSIAKVGVAIVLAIKKHEFGVCSNLLFNISEDTFLQANIQRNKAFHYPNNKKRTILIANGTGIAPFLGMLHQKPKNTYLFWGGRTKESFEVYKPFFKNFDRNNLHRAYSQEEKKEYVQDVILNYPKLIAETLNEGGVIMICGSLVMKNAVLHQLEVITTNELNQLLSSFEKQIKTDCY